MDLVVVGLGGSGLAAVHAALDAERSVVGIDAGPHPAVGAAGRNGGFLLAGLAAFHPEARARWGEAAAALYAHTLTAMAAMAEETPDLVVRAGSLRVETTAAGQAALDVHHEALRADGFRAVRVPAGLFLPDDGVFDPFARSQARAGLAVRRGADLVQATVRGVEPGAVRTDRGVVQAEAVLVCVDGGLARIVPNLAGHVVDVRLQMLCTGSGGDPSPAVATYLRDGLDYAQRRPDGTWFVGGGRDVSAVAERTSEDRVTQPVQGHLDALLAQVGGGTVRHRWAGIVGYSPDGLPWCRPVPEQPGVWAAGGYCGTGNVVGWMAGRSLVAQALDGVDALAACLDQARTHASARVG